MMSNLRASILLAVALLAVSGSAEQAKVTPVQKVIQLMQGMLEKGKKEKHEEQVQFAAYKQFCDDTTVEKTRAIKEAAEQIEKLSADIQKYEADAEKLTKEIAEHDEDISVWEGDIKAATKVREIENTDYTATHKDYSESIDALGRAINVLKKSSGDKKQARAALMEVSAFLPKEAQRTVAVLLQQRDDHQDENSDYASQLRQDGDAFLSTDLGAPQANAYEFQSQGIIDMLQKLLDKFEGELDTLEKEETNARHAFEMLVQDLNSGIEQSTKAREDKSATKATKLQSAADAKSDLEDVTSTKKEDEAYLADLTATCEQKATDFESRQQLRQEEIEAIEKAIEIISGNAVSGAADKHLPSLIQLKSSSFAQLRADGRSPAQLEVAAYLKGAADRTNSRVLAALAVRVTADPFKKVKKMIKDMIVKLMEEANEEAEHKGWCDKELSTNEQTRNEKTEAVETLHAEIDELQASIAKLTTEITELTEAVAALDEAVAKATKIREEEKAKNAQTIEDAKGAQEAVAQALTVLKEFYAKAGEATALLQQQPEAPEVFDEPYKGMGGESGGVVGMLEVIESDFARLEAETTSAEAQSQKEYDQFMDDSAIDKAQKSKDIEHKTAKKQNQEQALVEAKTDLEGTQKELDAALAYYEKLKPSCVDADVSYEDRVARRKEEIDSLQEALKILNGEDI